MNIILEDTLKTHSICFSPPPSNTIGGPFRLISLLAQHLPKYGWRVTDNPEKADIVHGHALCKTDRLDVYTNHGVYPITAESPIWQRQANQQIARCFKIADEVTTISKWTASQWQWWEGIDPHIIYNFVDLKEWDEIPKDQFRTKPFALWSKISPYRGIGETLELAKRNPNIEFVVTLAPAELVKPTNVTITGVLPFDQMKLALRDCSVYLALSAVDNFPFQVLEAMALGKPVLAFATGGIPEAIEHKKSGYIVYNPTIDEIQIGFEYCLEHAEELGQGARERVEKYFSVEAIVPQYIKVYEKILVNKKARKKSPKCSIVITTCNFKNYVQECIDSALSQDYHSFEVIVVDDHSTDGTWDVIRNYGKKIQARQFESPAGKIHGIVRSRNEGVSLAKGEFVACLDGDDKIRPDFLSKLVPPLEKDPLLGIAYSDFELFGESQGVIKCSEFDFEKLKHGNFIPCCNLFRKKAWQRIGGCRPVGESWEDYNTWLTMTERGWEAKHLGEPLYLYRKKGNQGRDFESQPFVQRLRAVVNAYHPWILPPKVSVIIPCYKHEQYLKEAIDSVLVQTYQDFEIVVVNDGSPGNVKKVLDEYWDPRVRLIEQQNKGLASARNLGISQAYGKLILPLDADDKLHPIFLENAVKLSDSKNNQVVVYSDFIAFWDDGQQTEEKLPDYHFELLLQRDLMPCTILYPKSAWKKVGGYKSEMKHGYEDWEFAIALGELGYYGVRIPEHLFYYRQHSGTSMRNVMEQRGLNKEAAAMIRSLHEQTYASFESKLSWATIDNRSAVGKDPVRLRYTGSKENLISYQGKISKKQYNVSAHKPYIWVEAVDVEEMLKLHFERA